jgi:hypothetical protein
MRFLFTIGFSLFLANGALAQNEWVKTIRGKVVSDIPDLDGIYIINLKSDVTTATEIGGYFSISVAVGDTLLFSSVQIIGRKVVITDKDLAKDLFLIPLEPKINRLDEVIVKQYKEINAVSLGIIAADTKHYTPAERRLKVASGVDPRGNKDGSTGGSVALDPLFNWMSGRTAMLAKELEVERKETLLQKIENQFGIAYCIEKLKIPKEYVKGFWYYIVEENRFTTALKGNNTTMTTFIMTELATTYLSLHNATTK